MAVLGLGIDPALPERQVSDLARRGHKGAPVVEKSGGAQREVVTMNEQS